MRILIILLLLTGCSVFNRKTVDLNAYCIKTLNLHQRTDDLHKWSNNEVSHFEYAFELGSLNGELQGCMKILK